MISKTFCPAKWDEILINLSANYVYSCCKSVPVKITKKEDINRALESQRQNLLNEIQDSHCNYCWDVENNGHLSKRHEHLAKINPNDYNLYTTGKVVPKFIEVNLGNECNFQCMYCNPKFSSQWETDVLTKPYKTYSDKFFYAVEEKNSNNIANSIEWLKQFDYVEKLSLIGGEPLQNKNFYKVIDSIGSKYLELTTNLSCQTVAPIDKILNLSNRYEEIYLGISIDSTRENAEFTRYGMNFELLLANIKYLLENAPGNVKIFFNSVMTSITIRDIASTIDLIDSFHKQNNSISWNIHFCRDPNIFTLNTLPDQYKDDILNKVKTLENKAYTITGIQPLQGAIITSKFNNTLYKQMVHFLQEFSGRKNISIPNNLNL